MKTTRPQLSRRAPQRRNNGSSVGNDPFYIVAASPVADDRTRVLKQGDTFAVCDHYGDMKPGGMGEEGLFHEGTRFLSALLLELGHERPLLLSSTIKEDNALLTVDLTNPDVRNGQQEVVLSRGTLHLFRSRFLWRSACYEKLRVVSYGSQPIAVSLVWRFAADYADIFEVRGTRRKARGVLLEPELRSQGILLAYEGLDGVVRQTELEFTEAPVNLTPSSAQFELTLHPQQEVTLGLTIRCQTRGNLLEPPAIGYETALADYERTLRKPACSVTTSNERFNDWLDRSSADLSMMISETTQGPYPYAGVPWFSTPFGRDGLITAWQCLWLRPEVAGGVLKYLALSQAQTSSAEQDAEPGKILHETRSGEMAALGEVPFGRYYGSVDSTPLFVMLAADYYRRTGDLELIASLWPNLELALDWMNLYGDVDGDGFVEYARRTDKGLAQQGWKDSHDSIFHADGQAAQPPIALCEVQGYVYAAKRGAAELATLLGKTGLSTRLVQEADLLQERFEEAFWCDELSTYAIALDGRKRPCRVRNSNAGHCLMTGIASPEHAQRTGRTLLSDASFSGFGIRTIAAGEVRFNPMSYHNGSVWPHDNAIVAHGLARYGLKEQALRVLDGLFEASLFVDLHRMPELFCGFDRRAGEGPTLYPVACAPQSWAAAAVFSLLQSCLGLQINAPKSRVEFRYPLLPESLREVRIGNLRVGDACVDLFLQRHGRDVGVNVVRRDGPVDISIVK